MRNRSHGIERDATIVEATYGCRPIDDRIWPDAKVRAAQVLRAAFPVKAVVVIQQYCGCPERTARNWLSAHSEPPWSVLDALLVGAEGDKVFHELMRGREPAWYRRLQHALKILAAIEGVNDGSDSTRRMDR